MNRRTLIAARVLRPAGAAAMTQKTEIRDTVERTLVDRVEAGLFAECWAYDQNQALIDRLVGWRAGEPASLTTRTRAGRMRVQFVWCGVCS